MVFSKNLAVAALASSAYAANFNVVVGQGGALTFSPQTVNAAVGDTVTFQFAALNHTVTSGTANQGCVPDGTFNSGFIPVSTPSASAAAAAGGNNAAKNGGNAATKNGGNRGGAAGRAKGNWVARGVNNVWDVEKRSDLEARQQGGPYTFTYTVKDTNPQVFYCAQLVHCQNGMVGVINPTQNGATSLNAYQQLSAKTQLNTLPNTAAGTGGTLNRAARGVLGKQAATPPAGPNNQGQTLKGFAALQAAQNGGNTAKTGNTGNTAKTGNTGKTANNGGNRGAAAANRGKAAGARGGQNRQAVNGGCTKGN